MSSKLKLFVLFCSLAALASTYLLTDSFIICCSLATALVLSLLLFLLLNKQLRQTNWYRNQFIDCEKFSGEIPRDLDICNLGSNSAKFAFNYEDMPVKGANWAVGPQSLSYDFRILKNYFSYLKDSGTVIITIAPFVCCLMDYQDDRTNAKYYRFLNSSLITNYSNFKKMLYLQYPVLSAPRAIRYLIRDVLPDNRFLLSINPMTPAEIEQDAVNWINGWKQQFSIANLDADTISEEDQQMQDYNTRLLMDIIDFCIMRNLKPVIVILPVTKTLRAKFSKMFCELYIYSFIRNANIRNIQILDYMDDERFMDNDLYLNSFFMNSRGRKVFTNAVLDDIYQIGQYKSGRLPDRII